MKRALIFLALLGLACAATDDGKLRDEMDDIWAAANNQGCATNCTNLLMTYIIKDALVGEYFKWILGNVEPVITLIEDSLKEPSIAKVVVYLTERGLNVRGLVDALEKMLRDLGSFDHSSKKLGDGLKGYTDDILAMDCVQNVLNVAKNLLETSKDVQDLKAYITKTVNGCEILDKLHKNPTAIKMAELLVENHISVEEDEKKIMEFFGWKCTL